ncbi:Bifunctional AAC/APH [Actinoplanes sp. SE50]|uniref:phosphotransferase family protein n=1 Tax=unclassified Actinoplanes TaxID=2626549 RepID=UPI00023ED25D|nr:MULTISPECIES: phosphotransferase [unclassified Actinoplanes]AEV84967.1 Bifunctional AAC/APH [Actinoplanes sp. SE50/110]ATO83358.1 Bifunctional AAC/APH [Actinoplanes sp. SE50]SLM00765.1 bifunctional AAC/APH [Actinoplanes sp. SE50/110]
MPDVRRLIATALPDYRVESVSVLGQGLDNVAYEINGDLIVRLSKTPDASRTVREARLLTEVRRFAPLPVPEPVLTLAEQGCLAYRKLPGVPLLDLPAAGQPERIIAALRDFLAALHAIAPERLAGLADADEQAPSEWLEEAAETYAFISHRIPASYRPRVDAFLSAEPPPAGDTLVFSHNDLGIEHVLIDPATSQVTGIIDWSDAALVDPAHDPGRLYRDLGPAALPADQSPAVHDRAIFYARCGVLEDFAYGVETGRTRYTEKSLNALAWLFPP